VRFLGLLPNWTYNMTPLQEEPDFVDGKYILPMRVGAVEHAIEYGS